MCLSAGKEAAGTRRKTDGGGIGVGPALFSVAWKFVVVVVVEKFQTPPLRENIQVLGAAACKGSEVGGHLPHEFQEDAKLHEDLSKYRGNE